MQKDTTTTKIISFSEAVSISKKLRAQGKKIILSHGVFDLLHPGHIKHFESAKRKADILMVTITKDEYVNKGPGRPVFNHRLRAESLAALECVDYVAINEWPNAVETILRIRPHFYVKGSEYREREDDVTGKIYDEERAIKSAGGEMIFTDEITFSSSQILNQFFSLYPAKADTFLRDFKMRYSSDFIINILKGLNKLKVLVIGDIIIDEYHYCIGIGKPQKADVLATRYVNEEKFTGGALAVAKHIAGFCKKVTIVSSIGLLNDYKDFIDNNLMPNIDTKFFLRKDTPTVVKRRYLNPSFLNKNFEINFIDDSFLPLEISQKVCKYLNKVLREYDLVIAADFGHGFITRDIVEVLCKRSKFLAVNTQTNSANMGFNLITKYKRADYVCIDEPEIRLAMQDKFQDLEGLIIKLRNTLHCSKIIVTRGHEGAMAYEKKKNIISVPIFSEKIVDRLGAGDAFLSVTAPVVLGNYPLEVAGFIGNAVGAMAVLIVGNKSPIEPVSLFKFIKTLLK